MCVCIYWRIWKLLQKHALAGFAGMGGNPFLEKIYLFIGISTTVQIEYTPWVSVGWAIFAYIMCLAQSFALLDKLHSIHHSASPSSSNSLKYWLPQ